MIRRVTVVLFSAAVGIFWLWFTEGQLRPFLTPTPPPAPSAETPWTGGMNAAGDIERAFNHARQIEEQQLGVHLRAMVLPDERTWDSLSPAQQALYLINREREARGLAPFAGLSPAANRVAQAYADRILGDDVQLSHDLGGQDPGKRLAAEPEIRSCMRGWAENLAAFWTSAERVPMPVARAVYGWMYEDGKCCDWGHRHALLTDMFHNGPRSGGKGLLGIGLAEGGPYQGLQSGSIVVMDALEPCRRWDYSTVAPDQPDAAQEGRSPAPTAMPPSESPFPGPIDPAEIFQLILNLLRG